MPGKSLLTWFFLILLATTGWSQSLFTVYKGGFIYPDDRLAGLIRYTQSAELQYLLPGDKEGWLSIFKEPEVGFALKYTHFRHQLVGQSINPFLLFNFNLLGKEKFYLKGSFGSGVAYFSQKYNPENGKNKAIGSHVTFSVRFGGLVGYDSGPWRFRLQYDVDHYSTGAITAPNLGMNHNNIGLSIGRKIGENRYTPPKPRAVSSNFHFLLETGIKEFKDEIYNHYSVSFFYSARIIKFLSLSAGANLFVNEALKAEMQDKNLANSTNNRNGISLGPQFKLGRSLINIHQGWFLNNPYDDASSYQHIVYRYFLLPNVAGSMSLRALNFNTSYAISIGIGISI